jgi:hypothetical protein
MEFFMAIHMRSCAAFFLILLMMIVCGCSSDVQDLADGTEQPGSSPVANTPPTIELIGDSIINVPLNASFVEPGVVATDYEDGDLSSLVFSDSANVNTSRPGRYEITYRVSDSGNLAASPVKRVVVVSASETEPSPSESEQPLAVVPSIAEIKLVGFTSERELVELQLLVGGGEIDLSLVAIDMLNVVADSDDDSKTGSVHFKLSGPVAIDRWENNPIYTMAVESTGLRISGNELPTGSYTLAVTPYSEPDMGGKKGAVKSIDFSVVDKKIVSAVPKIGAIDLVAVSEGTGEYMPVSRITEGAEIDLSKMPSALVNLIAISEDASNTGSVQFSLDGPVSINRVENNAAYALADEYQHLDITNGGLPAGDYTLIVTPYSKAGATGDAGIPMIVNFSVARGAVAAPTNLLQAHSDSYVFLVGTDAQPGMSQAVSANDTFSNDAEFVVTRAPSNGVVTMFDLGFFTYVPNVGFSGNDSFTYQIRQAGTSSSANVNIKVDAPAVIESSGFTAFKPSADSKVIYVSSSAGNDRNTCLSESSPCKTIGAGLEKMRKGYPDHVYLKRGDVWRDETLQSVQSGRSANEPAVVAFYGKSGSRPKLEVSARPLWVYKESQRLKNVHFIGLEFAAYRMDPDHPQFTGGGDSANIFLVGPNSDLLFEDNKFDYMEVIIHHAKFGNPANIKFRRNIWTGGYINTTSYEQTKRPSNLFVDGAVGLLIEENVFDHGGWNPRVKGAGANMYNHNMYLNYENDGRYVVLRGNIVTRGSSHGVHGRSGGLFEDNFFARNTVSLQMGYRGRPVKAGVKATARNNVITEGMSMFKGVDACNNVVLCTGAIWGLYITELGEGVFRLENNVVSNGVMAGDTAWEKRYQSPYRAGIWAEGNDSGVAYIGNIDWDWTKSAGTNVGYSSPGRTLADYNQSLGGKRDFDEFMNVVLNRELQQWNPIYSAYAINTYIRAGFGK